MSWIGCVDKLADTCISGWAAGRADRDKPVQVEVIVNSRVVARVPCEIFREDLLFAGIGDGCKGFHFDPSPHLKPGRNQLEVCFAGTGMMVPKGRGAWVKRREGKLSEWEAVFLAALEAYHEFRPEHHVCGIGEGAGELERVLFEAGIPCRKFTTLDVPCDPAVIRPEKADLVISWAWSTPVPEVVRLLKRIMRDLMKKPGFLAIGFIETRDVSEQIRRAFQECGISQVRLESIGPALAGRRRIFAFAEAGKAKRPWIEAKPVLAHIHVPKCAGTSFRILQERYFGPRHVGLYVDDTYFVYKEETIRGYLVQYSGMQGFSSHHVRVFPRWLAGRKMLYVTLLRDPVQQLVSYMTHIKKHYSRITSKSLLAAVPPDAPRLTLREFARWLLTQDRDIPFRENHNVNFFARHSAPAAWDRLEAAKAALEGFFFVGTTERMDESMAKLRALTREAGLDFPPGHIQVENSSAEYRDDLSWIHSDDEVGSLVLRSVAKDRQLYDWAVARLEQIGR